VCNPCARRERAFEQQHGIQVAAMDASEMLPPGMPEGLPPLSPGMPPLPEGFPPPPKKQHPNLTDLFGVNPLPPIKPFGDEEEVTDDDFDTKLCAECHTPLEDARFGMHMGCTNCYDAFRQELRAIFSELQGCSSYKGDIPEWLKDRLYKRSVERDLQKAIAADDFEKAKQLKDELRKLEASEKDNNEGDDDER
jgi:hypothetical protein